MIDKNYCMSSYLAFRYIVDPNIDFGPNLKHKTYKPLPKNEKTPVINHNEIGNHIKEKVNKYRSAKKGILLSGGMDSAIVASYLKGCDAYTFRFIEVDNSLNNNSKYSNEIKRAEYYSKVNNLKLHYVDISWKTVEDYIDSIMINKGAPIHSIEVQLYQAAIQAKKDNVEVLFSGATSDLIFGGMDLLLSKDWNFDEFVDRYMFTNPADVLIKPFDVTSIFEKYRIQDNIDFINFLSEISLTELSTSYNTIFDFANIEYCDPYSDLMMAKNINLDRIRKGDSKYLIRELMKERYPAFEIPKKIPMPRPVDVWFKNWKGPKRKEFKKNLDMAKFTGNQKWQLYCLERFLNLYE